MPLAFNPQPFTELFARRHAALVKVWDTDVIAAGDKDFNDRPGLHPENVFDGTDEEWGQYRIIASREGAKGGTETILHISVSFATGADPVYRKRLCADGLAQALLNIPPDIDPLHCMLTKGGTFHWVYAWDERWAEQ